MRPTVQFFVLALMASTALLPTTDTSADEITAASSRPIDAPSSLKGVEIPHVPGLLDGPNPLVVNRQKAVALGKALFWDQNVGSDGMACASCHFHAGADSRRKNQVNPGLLNHGSPTRETYEPLASGVLRAGPNYLLKSADFRFRAPTGSPALDDVVSSAGTFGGLYVSDLPFRRRERCKVDPHTPFSVGGIATRRVEPRNTPTIINAIFFLRNFWDGRASSVFNGRSPFGVRDTTSGVWVRTGRGSSVAYEHLRLENSSLASQAVGPVLNSTEMSCDGRTFGDVARRVLNQTPLSRQKVHPQDSVLGSLRVRYGKGLRPDYEDLIEEAFSPRLWSGRGNFGAPTQGGSLYSHLEANFPFFFGVAVQLYTSTLVSDDAPYDRYMEGNDLALTDSQKRGLEVFMGQGKCIGCHAGPQFTKAGTPAHEAARTGRLVERTVRANGTVALSDFGFENIGVTPTSYDVAVGAFDGLPNPSPLSYTAQYIAELSLQEKKDSFFVDPCSFEERTHATECLQHPDPATELLAVNGAFKIPTLRNVELTGPYMHNGSLATLESVIGFYNFGGSPNPEKSKHMGRLNLTADQQADLFSFLRSLTDDRVRYSKAPFDHPELLVPHGHYGDEHSVEPRNSRSKLAKDSYERITAVGAEGTIEPLKNFEEVLQQ